MKPASSFPRHTYDVWIREPSPGCPLSPGKNLGAAEALSLLLATKNALLMDRGHARNLMTMSIDDLRSALQKLRAGEVCDLGPAQIRIAPFAES